MPSHVREATNPLRPSAGATRRPIEPPSPDHGHSPLRGETGRKRASTTVVGIRAVVFDLFVTLTDFDAERARPGQVLELGAALGVEPAGFSALMRSTFTERATGALGDIRSTLATLAARLGHEPIPAQLDAAVGLRMAHDRRLLMAGVLDVLAGLHARGHRIGVLTDCTADTAELWPSLPYAPLVDAVVFSCETGLRKPDPRGYLEVARKLGVDPEECVHVGDGGSRELSGAAAVGMTPVLVETPFGADVRYDAELDWAGRTIPDLHELDALLGRLARD